MRQRPRKDPTVAAGDTNSKHIIRATGTSFSAPLVTAAGAIYLENNPAASPEAVVNHILTTATPNVLRDVAPAANRILSVSR